MSIKTGQAQCVFERMIGSLEETGYAVHWKLIRACDFGLPQIRERLFIIGFKQKNIPFEFPKPIPLQMTMSDVFGASCHRKIGRTVLTSFRFKRVGKPFNWDCYLVEGKERWLTSKEIIQMQGFPDWFQFPVSESQKIKQLGNSVAVPAVQAVGREILHSLIQAESSQRHQQTAA